MSAVPLLNAYIDAFAIECQNVATSSDWGHIQAARNAAMHFRRLTYRDLRQFMTTISGNSSITQAIRTRAGAVVTQLDTAVVANHTGTSCSAFGCTDYTGAGGLSIYLPSQGSGTDSDYNATNLTFCDYLKVEGTDWRDFILKLPGGTGTTSSKFTDDWGQSIVAARVLETSAGVRSIVDSVIGSAEDVDFFRITAAEGQLLYATAYGDGLVPGEEPGLIPILTIYGPDGETVLAQAEGSSNGQASTLPTPIPGPGDYYLAVTSLGNGDPLNPAPGETEGRYTLDLIYGAAEEVNPGLSVSEDVVDFGEVEVASSSCGSLVLTNTGATSLEITACSLPDDSPFFVSGRFAIPTAMGPFESMGLFVGMRPDELGPVSDTLRIYSTDPDQEYYEVELRAVGVDNWASDDIGDVGEPGSDSLDRGVWTIRGAGEGVGGTADECHYAHRLFTGHADLVARVVSVEETEQGGEAGVMVRESLEPDSPYAAVLVGTDGRVSFRYRSIAGEDTNESTVDVGDLPVWVRIVRRRVEDSDDEVEGYVSIDGETWQLIGSGVISLPDTGYAGLAVTSHSDGLLCTAILDGVTMIEPLKDSFEPNDTFETAVALGIGPQHRAGLGIDEPNDQDWLSWTACYDGMVRFETLFEAGGDHLGLALYNADRELLTEAIYEPGMAWLEWDAVAGEEYYVHVYAESMAAQSVYDLIVAALGDCENYAVLFSGGGSANSNFERYYDNTVELYDVLVNEYDLDEDHIFVLFSDGGAPGLDQNTGTRQNPVYVNSDMSFAANANVEVGTATQLQTTLNTLANTLDANDHLFFWAFDHGDGYHTIQGYSGYDQNATTITTEETLTGWGSGQDIDDDQLVTWLNQIPAGHITVVLTECFAGGMLDEMRPMANTAFGAAATNHYEFSWGDGFAAAFTEALYNPATQTMHRNTYDAYKYAHDHDSYAVTRGTYTKNTGTPGNNKEHPWSETTTNFPIFCGAANIAPMMVSADVIRLKNLEAIDLVIPYDLLGAACTAEDANGDAVSYRIETVEIGELAMNGEPVVPGRTVVQYGEEVVWHRPDGVAGDVAAFTVRAFDGMTVSDQRMPVILRIGDPVGALVAVDDEVTIDEEVVSVIDVLGNDTGDVPLEVIRVGAAAHGTVILEGGIGGSVVYLPAQDFFGEDSFTYFVRDASGATDWATVHLTVENVNDAP